MRSSSDVHSFLLTPEPLRFRMLKSQSTSSILFNFETNVSLPHTAQPLSSNFLRDVDSQNPCTIFCINNFVGEDGGNFVFSMSHAILRLLVFCSFATNFSASVSC